MVRSMEADTGRLAVPRERGRIRLPKIGRREACTTFRARLYLEGRLCATVMILLLESRVAG